MRLKTALGLALLAYTHTVYAQGYVRFDDPIENAFSVMVPQSWHVEGGIARSSPSSFNFVVTMRSPDGQFIRIGDPSLTTFTAPGAPGTPGIGQRWAIGQGVVTTMLPYMDGLQFAERWGQQNLAHTCGPNLRPLFTGILPPPSGQQTDNTGHVVFACGKYLAYAFATTRITPGVQSPYAPKYTWSAINSVFALAPPERLPETISVIDRFIVTARIHEPWMIQQQQVWGVDIQSAGQRTRELMAQQERTSVNMPGSTSAQIDEIVRGYETTGHGERPVGPNGSHHWACAGHPGQDFTTQSYMPPGPNCVEQ